MIAFFRFLAEASVLMLLMYALYYWLLHREAFYTGSRIFLLASLLLPVLIPIWNIPVQTAKIPAVVSTLSSFTITPDATQASLDAGFANITWFRAITWLYWLGFVFAGILLMWRIFRIIIFLRSPYQEERISHTRVKLIPGSHQAFAFFGQLFIGENIPLSSREAVVRHERSHSQQGHSADKLLVEGLQVLFWFHPAVYFIKRELTAIHEYLADRQLISQYSPEHYRRILLRQTPAAQFVFSDAFYQSLTLKRLAMLNSQKSRKTGKKRFYFALVMVALLVLPFACSENNYSETGVNQKMKKKPSEEILQKVEKMPKFPGGSSAMRYFIAENIEYPEEARDKGIQGMVFVRFAIMKNGNPDHIQVVKGEHELLNNAAKKVIHAMPAWKPGKQGGHKVNVWFTLPVRFALNEESGN